MVPVRKLWQVEDAHTNPGGRDGSTELSKGLTARSENGHEKNYAPEHPPRGIAGSEVTMINRTHNYSSALYSAYGRIAAETHPTDEVAA